jgi:hypothetical protein
MRQRRWLPLALLVSTAMIESDAAHAALRQAAGQRRGFRAKVGA